MRRPALLPAALLLAGCAAAPAAAPGSGGATGGLTVHPVLGTTDDDPDLAGGSSVPDPDGGPALVLGPAVLTRADVVRASAEAGSPQGPADAVTVEWSADGAVRWAALTGAAACAPPGEATRRVVVLLDGAVVSAPAVSPAVQCEVGVVGGVTQLTGSFTVDEAARIAAELQPEPR